MTYTEHLALELRRLSNNPEAIKAAHIAIENVLVEWRDQRLSTPLVANGLVIKERDGKDSHIIRLTVPDALMIGLKAIANYIEANP